MTSLPSPARRTAVFRVAATLLALAGAACTSADPGGQPSTMPTGAERDTEVKHEPCDMSSPTARRIDVNGDGRPDIIHVLDAGGREVCRVVDLNLDGAVDAFVYYDAAGRERRRESDYDRDGRADEIVHMRDGVLFMKERETNFDDKIDTWDYYDGDRIARRERDSDADGLVDQWWSFNDPTDPRCALVATDRNVDGKPDPDTVLDLCADARAKAAKFPPNPAPPPSPPAPAPSNVPSPPQPGAGSPR